MLRKHYIRKLLLVALFFSPFFFNTAHASWVEPTLSPPQGIYPPEIINTGTGNQEKAGDLVLSGLRVDGNGQFGSLGVSRSSANAGDLNTDSVRTDGRFCLKTSCISSWSDLGTLGGTANHLSKWKDANSIEDSGITETATTITITSITNLFGKLIVNNSVSTGLVLKKLVNYTPPIINKSKLALSVDASGNIILVKLAGGAPPVCIPTEVTGTRVYTAWTPAICPASGQRTRTYTYTSSCGGTVGPIADVSQSCTYVPPLVCVPSEVLFPNPCITAWGACDQYGYRTRTCPTRITALNCSTSIGTQLEEDPYSCTPPSSQPPSIPIVTSLIRNCTATGIAVSWTASTPGTVAGLNYRVQRCNGASCDFTNITLNTTTTNISYSDTTANVQSTIYRYRIQAETGGGSLVSGYSSPSNSARITCGAPTSPGPTLSLVGSSCSVSIAGGISLSWNHVSVPGSTIGASYRLERCTGAGCSNFLAPSGSATLFYPNFIDPIADGLTYLYRVLAFDPDIPSRKTSYSSPLSVVAPNNCNSGGGCTVNDWNCSGWVTASCPASSTINSPGANQTLSKTRTCTKTFTCPSVPADSGKPSETSSVVQFCPGTKVLGGGGCTPGTPGCGAGGGNSCTPGEVGCGTNGQRCPGQPGCPVAPPVATPATAHVIYYTTLAWNDSCTSASAVRKAIIPTVGPCTPTQRFVTDNPLTNIKNEGPDISMFTIASSRCSGDYVGFCVAR